MNFLKRGLWAAVASAVVAGGASAQVGGGATGGTGGLGGGGTGGLANLGSLLGGGTGGGGGGQGGGGGGGGTNVNNQILNVAPSSNIQAPSSIAQAPQSVATSNALGRYYANPIYQGRAGSNTSSALSPSNIAPGGFGTAIYGTSGGAATTATGGGRGGAAGGGFGGTATSGFGGAATGAGGGGFGGTTGGIARGGATGGAAGGLGRAGATGQAGQGQVVNQGAPGISYTATIKFDTPTVTPAQFQADLQAVISRSSSLSNPAGVQLTVAPNGRVNLRGRVKDEDEARLVEGLLRITPGVRDVTNELQFPKQ